MNEIVGPIYYVFATDSRKEWRGNTIDCNYTGRILLVAIRYIKIIMLMLLMIQITRNFTFILIFQFS